VVTGGGNGIGRALAERFHREGARAVAVIDLELESALAVAEKIGGMAFGIDVSNEAQLADAVSTIEGHYGRIDLFCSNAGIGRAEPDHVASASNRDWLDSWNINVMAHVYAVRHVLPGMLERGAGYFVHTASAAGLLSQINNASYSTTKHAAIGFAESVAITHGDDGIRVSVLCPQAVDTRMMAGAPKDAPQSGDGMLSPEAVAEAVVQGIRDEMFLILPHPQVAQYIVNKATNYDRWIGGMRKLRRRAIAAGF
jgi:NAD(P)-dependent dehydrogenase (short-subunit alcohol dehydrogenase family)